VLLGDFRFLKDRFTTETPCGNHIPGFNSRELSIQIRTTRLDFSWGRISIKRGTALDHVRVVDRLKSSATKFSPQKLAAFTNERFTGTILVFTWRFSYDNNLGILRAISFYTNGFCPLMQGTSGAGVVVRSDYTRQMVRGLRLSEQGYLLHAIAPPVAGPGNHAQKRLR
jgi:hypothetical protein